MFNIFIPMSLAVSNPRSNVSFSATLLDDSNSNLKENIRGNLRSKMGLPKIIQIPCHHVLANQNALKFKKGEPLNQFFNINLGIGSINFFYSYSWHISLWFYSNFDRESSLDVELNFTSNEYSLDILLMGPSTPKIRNT